MPPRSVVVIILVGEKQAASLGVAQPEERLVHTHRTPEVGMEEVTEPRASRQCLYQVARDAVHLVAVLVDGAGLSGHRQVAQIADAVPVRVRHGDVVPRVARPVAQRVLDGDVGRRPLVAQDEVLAEQARDRRRPRDVGVGRRVVHEKR